MARLSSTIRMRALRSASRPGVVPRGAGSADEAASSGSGMAQLSLLFACLEGDLQHEAGAVAAAAAVCREPAVHRLRGVRAVVQAEAVAFAPRREAVVEDLRQDVGVDADAVVLYLDDEIAPAVRTHGDAEDAWLV